jgi:hypothetical protein
MLVSSDILVLEDCVPISVQNNIENTLLSADFPWYYTQSSSIENASPYQDNFVEDNPLVEDTSQLFHSILTRESCWSQWRDIVSPLMLCFPFPILEFKRIKCNLKFINPSNPLHNIPHTDHWNGEGYVGLYYVNNSDGDTRLFKEFSYNVNEDEFDSLNIEKTIHPKKGTMVVFSGARIHAASNPFNYEKRCVINFNFEIPNG